MYCAVQCTTLWFVTPQVTMLMEKPLNNFLKNVQGFFSSKYSFESWLLVFSLTTILCACRNLRRASSDRVVCHNTAWLGVDYVCWLNLNYPGGLVCIFFLWLLTHVSTRLWAAASCRVNSDFSSTTVAPNDRFQALQAAWDLIWSVCVIEKGAFSTNTQAWLFH